MNPSRLFIQRPVAAALLMLPILLAGLPAIRLLPVSALPEVAYPTIEVTTLYPGASPDVMSTTVTAPLERQFGQMPGLNRMTSSSSGGASVITLDRYRGGTVGYLNVTTAQAAALGSDSNLRAVRNRQLAAANQLLKNIAGRWAGKAPARALDRAQVGASADTRPDTRDSGNDNDNNPNHTP